MRIVLASMTINPDVVRQLKALAPDSIVVAADEAAVAREIETADAFVCADVCYSAPIAAALATAPGLRWLQLTTVGYDNVARYGKPAGATLSNVGDAYSGSVGLHAFAMMLALQRAIPAMVANQSAGTWQRDLTDRLIMPTGHTLLMVGFGGIGREVARLSRVLGMTVIGVSRQGRPDPAADEVHPASRLHELLPRADVIVLALPIDATTKHMINARALALCKPSAFLINVGRGGLVDQDALVAALTSGRLAGAGLEVTDPEPLPAEHALWRTPNVLISPHISGAPSPHGRLRLVERVGANLQRYLRGEPVEHVVVL